MLVERVDPQRRIKQVAWTDGVDPHTILGQVKGDTLGQPDPTELGGSVGRVFVAALFARLGVDLDDDTTPLAIESAPDIVGPLLERRGIRFHPFVNVVEVDPDTQQIHSLEGETFDYDLAVLVPPHRGAAVVSDSGLGDSHGWVATDPETLRVRGFDGLFAIGDATDLPISKAGSTAHFEAPVIVEQIVASLRGRRPDPVKARYDGKVMCFLEVGGGKAVMLAFDYDRPIRSLRPSRRWHLLRRLFDRAYWSTVPRGRF